MFIIPLRQFQIIAILTFYLCDSTFKRESVDEIDKVWILINQQT